MSQSRDATQLNLDAFLCYAIYSAGHALTRYYKPLLGTLGLTYPQYLTMVALWEGDAHTVGSIAGRLSLDSHTLTPLLKRLETMGHIRRERDDRDERQVRIVLTRKGETLREKALEIPGCIRAAIDMSDADIQRLQSSLLVLRERVEEQNRAILRPGRPRPAMRSASPRDAGDGRSERRRRS